ncbi:AMP-binding protein [Aeromicrobium tamlense]|uniref:AMP-binding protein n=1 Tax=Aeromicrobium tamlense TaxID=375541 RepID=A0A8I0FUF8_9ACTN|nr:AMP-binding protein [Aeromicrobium tamlense]MBD1268713.1 AMP-binding protein [Aeromicrobium tamlense]NYI37381.1 long-chain acyl-CoA synthetase [Aeromicrobium tamlense]
MSDSVTQTRPPWLSGYPEGKPETIVAEYATCLEMFSAAVERGADAPAVRYFDGTLTYAEVDALTDAIAAVLVERGFVPGDRLALYLQNDPAFPLGLVAAWKAGGIAVLVNPMNKQREVGNLLRDSGAVALLTLDDLYATVARDVVDSGQTSVTTVITTSATDFQTRNDPRVLGTDAVVTEGTLRLTDVARTHAGRRVPAPDLGPDSIAVLTYTSGTTGLPKGAMNTHGAMTFNTQTYRDWMDLPEGAGVLAIAPLFHITGLVGHATLAMLLGGPLVLTHRFEPLSMLDAIREHRPFFTIGAITALVALTSAEGATRDDFTSLEVVYSGGAPIPPSVADRIEEEFGFYAHNFYGMTETTSPTHGVPRGLRAPVDPVSGALAVGFPVFNTHVRVVDEDGAEVPVGQIGEFATSGPQVIPGYWNNPEATAEAIIDRELRTGDMGFMDADGWFFIVDRKKDMIIASGYKVWPREVEDVLYAHPAVKEAAVVGVAHEYRGETVKAYVALHSGAEATPDELIAFCRERMAAYKYPREVEVLDRLPQSVTGKILRRELR